MRQRSNLFWPTNILLGFIVVMGLMLASMVVTPLNVLGQIDPLRCPTNGPAQQPNPYPPYPECIQTAGPLLTGTAEGQNPAATNTPTTESNNNNNNNNPAPTNMPTATATATNGTATDPSDTTPTLTSTATATRTPAVATPADNDLPSPTPTSLLPDGVEARVCVPGETIEITGEGEPGTPLIVTFDARPVGGGSVRADGTYRITLRIGPERPGLYLVEVEQRDTRTVLQEFGCEVPAADVTPTPALGNG